MDGWKGHWRQSREGNALSYRSYFLCCHQLRLMNASDNYKTSTARSNYRIAPGTHLLPHFLRDTHQVQKNPPHSPPHHQLLNILPLSFLLHHPYHNLRGFHQDPPIEQQQHQYITVSIPVFYLNRKLSTSSHSSSLSTS